MNSKNKLNRFTTLPILLDILASKRLVLLNPETWADRNDSKILLAYKMRQGFENIFALCFAERSETIHHWNTFADGISGCCIEFDKMQLQKHLSTLDGVRCGSVVFLTKDNLKSRAHDDLKTPFTKRWAYKIEDEFRVIWESKKKDLNVDCYVVNIDLEMITKITMSQKMPEPIYLTIRDHLVKSLKVPLKKINRSTIFENQVWIEHFSKSF